MLKEFLLTLVCIMLLQPPAARHDYSRLLMYLCGMKQALVFTVPELSVKLIRI